MFFTNWVVADILNPVSNVSTQGRGKTGGWFGWYDDAKMEELRDSTPAPRRRKNRKPPLRKCRPGRLNRSRIFRSASIRCRAYGAPR